MTAFLVVEGSHLPLLIMSWMPNCYYFMRTQ
jgi:hypothetical protein